MHIASLFQKKRTVLSFEVFPPKKTSSIDTIYSTLDDLQGLKPDFISVTYGAGGNAGDSATAEIASAIKHKYHIEPVAHLTCVNYTKPEIEQILERLEQNNIENILALRGDISPDRMPKKEFNYASELIAYIKERGGFHLSGACYPEGHIESENLISDILNLKKKVDAGAEHLISQLLFDNNYFYSFLEKARIAGISVPIQAGIMPVVNKAQIERMVTLCGASLPPKFTKMLQRFEHSPEALRDAGIAYAVDQIVDLISQGVDGIHLYTMNNAYIAKKIMNSISGLIED
ncbi:methylenetetrahydrofolate reductase [NAD(P)H] [Lachnospiraceae bacterium MD1]|uniref:Methylenetetrahydrofolate reductase n=1 Tax=Variimorphobacter saccharofermentans TaxID=2755051 RepID=A0A839K464_9FIRM|nr:methylenetetrahydrofolate reductase [NAD(P)H] [Variimorphobacter saccharofermentans]MBB2184416.1 methylenetetrahydrofolate reductase [NAD(P)H] [Variimorphobacter saccharofermentans]